MKFRPSLEDAYEEAGTLNRFETPPHYTRGTGPIEYAYTNNLDFCEGNVVKYVTRHRMKNGHEDIVKAITYLKFILEHQYGIEADVTYTKKGSAK